MQVFRPGIAALAESKVSSGMKPTGGGWSIFCDAEHRQCADVDNLHPVPVECLHL
jgi:hypothetical protein